MLTTNNQPDTMMKTLIELPEDLLYLIALSFERDRGVLLALGRTCRTLYQATRSLLFRHLSDLCTERLELLERRIATDPSLQAYVHSYPLYMEYGEILEDGLQKSLGYSNLRELTFVSSYKFRLPNDLTAITRLKRLQWGRGEERDFQCGFLNTHSFARIRTIFLNGDFSATEIMRFMLLPSVQNLKAKGIPHLRAPNLSVYFAAQTSTLTSLSLVGDALWSIELETMRTIFLACPLLRELQCQVPMSTSPLMFAGLRKSRVNHAVSPVALNRAFAPLHTRLRRLSLLQIRHNVPYDGTHMDLSSFRELVDLEITSCCLLPPGGPCEARNMLCEFLPASLRHLKLEFPRESGIFFHHLEDEPFLEQDPSAVPQSRYDWISELLRHKHTYYPSLTHVDMQDPPGNIGYWCWLQAEWAPPIEISELVCNTGVNLTVNISYPDPKSEIESWNKRFRKRHESFPPWDKYSLEN